ncbi:MAG: hypothetical protein KDC47_10470, partial [Flavobacteriaceae bacterium]|nr:hypothetical protein [Flavobacteriaceae bacterium]
MQKVKNVLIKKPLLVFIFIASVTLSCYSQKRQIVENDYILLNKSIYMYFENKKISDSIFYIFNNSLDSLTPLHKIELIKRDLLDTIFLDEKADKKRLYVNFLKENAHWKREKRYQKYMNQLDSIFSKKELENYKNQLSENLYTWDDAKICPQQKVFVLNKSDLQKNKVDIKLSNVKSYEEYYRLNTKFFIRDRLFTFSKPIYSIKKNTALIAYHYGGNYFLYIF